MPSAWACDQVKGTSGKAGVRIMQATVRREEPSDHLHPSG